MSNERPHGRAPRMGHQRTEASFRAIADGVPELLWTANAEGEVEYVNAAVREYAGIAEAPDGTWRWQSALHPEDLERTAGAWGEAVATGRRYACEHRLRMADGDYRWHVSRARRVNGSRGAGTWFGAAIDIHAHKTTEEELRRLLGLRDRVASVVAHDLRDPLAIIKTAVPVLERTIGELPEETRARAEHTLRRIERQTARMRRLLEELVDAAALHAGRALTLHLQRSELGQFLSQVVAEQQQAHGAHTFQLQLPAEPLVGEWDLDRLERVLANLLSNAAKYSPEGSVVTVELERVGHIAVLRISDHGIGIPDGDRARIFEWFARSDNASSRTRGTGIGLAGARAIVEQHGGSMSVESTLGAGSTFSVALPLRSVQEDIESPEPASP